MRLGTLYMRQGLMAVLVERSSQMRVDRPTRTGTKVRPEHMVGQ